MSPDFLEKIRNIIVTLFVLFFSFLIMLITFCSLRVHAEEATIKHSYYVNTQRTYSSKSDIDENKHTYDTDLQFVMFCGSKNGDQTSTYNNVYYLSAYIKNDRFPAGAIYSVNDSIFSGHIDFSYGQYHNGDLISSEWSTYAFVFNNRYNDNGFYETIDTNVPMFDSRDHALAFCRTGDTTGLLNGGSIDNPDFEDTAYAFTGFTANNKMTANWTGTTERSYLQDQEVEEYVRVNYYFADKEAQDTIKQADAYPDEFATADKTLTIDVSGLKPDDENWFLRYIRITPCYRQAGLGAWGDFYHGSDVYVYFDVKGNIEKVIQKSKPTDLNKGNMVYDSSIGYLQNVIYTEQKTHDGSGRQATFKWSTLKSLPDDAQIEIVAQNFYIEWFNKKTEENFIYKEYGEDCFYSAGSYSFNANTPVWTWLKEKEIDPFSIKTQSYGSTEYYLRIVVYNDSDSLYHYGGWVKVDIKSKDTTIMPSTDVETGGFDDSSGLWNQDTASSDSYHYSTDDKGKLTGNIDVNSWEDLNMNSFTWMYRNMQSMVSSLGEFPAMVNAVFGYLPVQYITSIGVLLVAIVLLRFLGR